MQKVAGLAPESLCAGRKDGRPFYIPGIERWSYVGQFTILITLPDKQIWNIF
jgi:hypothetical protein